MYRIANRKSQKVITLDRKSTRYIKPFLILKVLIATTAGGFFIIIFFTFSEEIRLGISYSHEMPSFNFSKNNNNDNNNNNNDNNKNRMFAATVLFSALRVNVGILVFSKS